VIAQLITGLIFFAGGASAPASEADAESILKKYQEIKGDIVSHEEKKRKVLADLFTVTLGMKKINKRRELLMNEKHHVETRIKKAAAALQGLAVDLNEQRGLLRSRMRGLYKFNGQSAMRLIFSSQTPADLDRNLKMVKIVADKDYLLIRSYEKNLRSFSRETRVLESHKRRLSAIESELKNHEKELVAQQNEKSRILEGIDKQTLSQLVRLERIRIESSKISSVLSDPTFKLPNSFLELRGKLAKPVDGKVVQGFGIIEDRKYGIKLRSKGILIAVSPGTEVKSVFGGDVLFSDVVPGLGKTLILGHGDHYYTVYGNNSDLSVKKGQRVKAGDVIGYTGSSWHQRSPGSYFEIRHFSDLIDPEEWFEKRGRNL